MARILECLEALCQANKDEADIRAELEKLGYDRHGLTYQGLPSIGRIEDNWGSPAFYFVKEARSYIANHKGAK